MLEYLRSFRLGDGSAIFDYTSSILASATISNYTKIPVVLTTIGVLMLGEILHYFTKTQTRALKFLNIM